LGNDYTWSPIPLLKRLEQKKLINRTHSRTDERTVMISLTSGDINLKENAKQIPKK